MSLAYKAYKKSMKKLTYEFYFTSSFSPYLSNPPFIDSPTRKRDLFEFSYLWVLGTNLPKSITLT